MKSVIVKAQTTGSREQGNLRPIIADYAPRGVGLSCMEYGEGFCIVKIDWSTHPFIDVQPDPADLAKFLENVTIIETIKPKDYPKAEKQKRQLSIDADYVEELPGKKLKVKKSKRFPKLVGKEGSYIRKEKKQFGMEHKDVYIFDEG